MPAPPAATISVRDTLVLLDNPARFNGLAEAVLQDRYALWLGSGISRDRAPPLTGVIRKALIHLQQQVNPANANCKFKETLVQIMQLAGLSADEWARFDANQPVDNWTDRDAIISRLVNNYARLLDIPVDGKDPALPSKVTGSSR